MIERVKPWLWLVAVLFAQFTSAISYSLVPPFYPTLASSKSLLQWQYGLVFSLEQVGTLTGSVTSGKIMNVFGPQRTLFWVTVMTIGTQTLLGALYWIPQATIFWITSFVVLFLYGYSLSVIGCAVFAIITYRFQNHCIAITGVSEILWGVGNMLGSVTGGVLIDASRFYTPYFVCSGLFAIATVLLKVFPSVQKAESDNTSGNFLKVILNVGFAVDMFTVSFMYIVAGFNEVTFQPFLYQNFNSSSTTVGSVFTVQMASYLAGAVVWGVASFIYDISEFCLILGVLMCAISYILIGPASFMAFEPTLWLTYVSQVLMGMGMCSLFLCSYNNTINHLCKRGFEKNVWLYSIASVCIFTALYVTAILSPLISGFVVSHYGFQKASTAMFAFFIACFVGLLAQWIVNFRHRRNLSIPQKEAKTDVEKF